MVLFLHAVHFQYYDYPPNIQVGIFFIRKLFIQTFEIKLPNILSRVGVNRTCLGFYLSLSVGYAICLKRNQWLPSSLCTTQEFSDEWATVLSLMQKLYFRDGRTHHTSNVKSMIRGKEAIQTDLFLCFRLEWFLTSCLKTRRLQAPLTIFMHTGRASSFEYT